MRLAGRAGRHGAAAGALAALCVLGAGCSSDQAFRAWQRSLETYVTEHGNGDPNVLRALADDPADREFSLIGARASGVPFFLPARTDVIGLLLGHRRVGDRFWFIFVTGAVKFRGALTDFPLDEAQLLDIRPAAFSAAGGRYAWRLGESEGEALERYCAPQVEAWRHSDPGRASASKAPTRFPTPADAWQLEVDAGRITITDAHSGATWTMGTAPD